MNLGDYLLPWKAIPNMIKDVKAASKTKNEDGSKNYDSVFGAIGKYADPFGALMGDNWQEFFHEKIPREINRASEPWMEFHREKLDPIWRLGGKQAVGGDTGDFGMVTSTKGGDLQAAITAMVLGGMALGGGAAGSGSSGGSWNPYANMDWSNPQTYSRLPTPSQQQQQQPQQQYQPPDIFEAIRQRDQQRRAEEQQRMMEQSRFGLQNQNAALSRILRGY